MAATGTPTPNIGLRIPLGTDPASVDDINYNSNALDTIIGDIGDTSVTAQLGAANNRISAVQAGLAIVCNGNTHAAIESGQFAYVKNHGTLAEGLYRNNTGSTIAANATLSSSNLTADSSGGLNTVYDALNSNLTQFEKGITEFDRDSGNKVTSVSGLTTPGKWYWSIRNEWQSSLPGLDMTVASIMQIIMFYAPNQQYLTNLFLLYDLNSNSWFYGRYNLADASFSGWKRVVQFNDVWPASGSETQNTVVGNFVANYGCNASVVLLGANKYNTITINSLSVYGVSGDKKSDFTISNKRENSFALASSVDYSGKLITINFSYS